MTQNRLLVILEQFHQLLILIPQTQVIKTLHTELRRAHLTAFAHIKRRFLTIAFRCRLFLLLIYWSENLSLCFLVLCLGFGRVLFRFMREEKLLDQLFAVEYLRGDYGANHAHDMERARDTSY